MTPFNSCPKFCKKKGYLTGGVCGQYNCNRKFGFNQGFDYYDDDFIYVEDRSVEIAGGTFHPYSEKRAQYVVEKSIKWIQKVKDKNNPLFLWLHLMDPHAAYDPPENYGEKFSGSTVYSSRSFFGQSVPVNLIHRHAYVPGVTDYDYYLNKYDGEISYMDSTLKTLFDFLKRNNLYDDALILFTSDHGEYMGEQNLKINYFSHGSTLFESEIKVPLIVKLPQNEFANRQVNAHVSLVDIFPAIIHVVGEKDLYYEGTDLFNAIDNTDDATTVRTNFIQIGDIRPKEEGKKLAVRKGRYKLIVQSQYTILELVNLLHQKKKFDYSLFLYDLAHDPLERSDVSAVNSDIVEELSAELFNWLIGSDSDGEKSYRAEGRNDEETVKHLKSLGYLN
jgi:choline-sulfatase